MSILRRYKNYYTWKWNHLNRKQKSDVIERIGIIGAFVVVIVLSTCSYMTNAKAQEINMDTNGADYYMVSNGTESYMDTKGINVCNETETKGTSSTTETSSPTEIIKCYVESYIVTDNGTEYTCIMPDGSLHVYVVDDEPEMFVTLSGNGTEWESYEVIDLP